MSIDGVNDVYDLDFTKQDLGKDIQEDKELGEILILWGEIFGRDNEILQGILTKRKTLKLDFIGCGGRLRIYCIKELQKEGVQKNAIIDNLTTLNRIFGYLGIKRIFLSQLSDQVHGILQK